MLDSPLTTVTTVTTVTAVLKMCLSRCAGPGPRLLFGGLTEDPDDLSQAWRGFSVRRCIVGRLSVSVPFRPSFPRSERLLQGLDVGSLTRRSVLVQTLQRRVLVSGPQVLVLLCSLILFAFSVYVDVSIPFFFLWKPRCTFTCKAHLLEFHAFGLHCIMIHHDALHRAIKVNHWQGTTDLLSE